MNLKLMVLGKNLITGETNNKDTWEEIAKKLEEEYLEVQEAIREGDNAHIGEEVFDLIQVLLRALVKLRKDHMDLCEANRRHNRKLVKRGWTHRNIIRIFLDK